MRIETGAKVNLTLEVLRRRPDGYHELATVFQAIDLADRIELTSADSLEVTVHGADVPTDDRNLCHRAATALAAEAGIRPEVRIAISKRVPVGAGLGGGSANAAGTLAALCRFWGLGDDPERLHRLAAGLGSDVAFFLHGGAAVGLGRGERLEPLPGLPEPSRLVILSPGEGVATGRVYGALDGFRAGAGQVTERLAAGLRAGVVPPIGEWLVNDLELPAARVSAVVREDRERLAALLHTPFRLSGSGGAWFVPVPAADAEGVRASLAGVWPERSVWVARPVSHGWREVPA
ncbi:MAG: 4-(cytidine 5'-diphospho)-2-C-methyl-D-erythritol kinase [Armatimonadetes bacterium]|nr:4-(cytidine 5'-diphospho)-2-C-methyl-D-erythritol kinase [Armatimonadota bacterium]